MPNWLRLLSLLVVVFGLVGCDQVSKDVAKSHLEEKPGYALVGDALELRYAENRDIAFNALRVIPEPVRKSIILSTGAVAIVLLGVALTRLRDRRGPALAFAVILAGAIGNYWDRLARGYVIDFVHLAHWPVFNLADVYILLGGVMFLLLDRRFRRASA